MLSTSCCDARSLLLAQKVHLDLCLEFEERDLQAGEIFHNREKLCCSGETWCQKMPRLLWWSGSSSSRAFHGVYQSLKSILNSRTSWEYVIKLYKWKRDLSVSSCNRSNPNLGPTPFRRLFITLQYSKVSLTYVKRHSMPITKYKFCEKWLVENISTLKSFPDTTSSTPVPLHFAALHLFPVTSGVNLIIRQDQWESVT